MPKILRWPRYIYKEFSAIVYRIRIWQMSICWCMHLCMLQTTSAQTCVQNLCLWLGFLWQFSSYSSPLENATFAIFAKDVSMYQSNIFEKVLRYISLSLGPLFLFFYQMMALQILWKNCCFSSWDIEIFIIFFLSFPHFPDSKGQMKVE